MGGILFAVYTSKCKNRFNDIQITQIFNKMKHRGDSFSNLVTTQSVDIHSIPNKNILKTQLSKAELKDYQQYNFVYGYHRSNINDASYNSSQPFEDPIPLKISEYPELKRRVNRKLLCNGEIYNYKKIVDEQGFSDADLCSSSDVEVVLPLYIKHGLLDTLDIIDGEFAFVLTENTNTYKTKDINVFIARDPLGTRPLYMINNPDKTFFLFVSELGCLPEIGMGWEVKTVPIGSYWSFNETFVQKNYNFTRYVSLETTYSLDKCMYTTATPENLEIIYYSVKDTLSSSVAKMSNFDSQHTSIGILLSDGFDSSVLLYTLLNNFKNCGNSNNLDIHLFSYGKDTGVECIESLSKQFPECRLYHHNINDNSVHLTTSELERIRCTLGAPETVPDSSIVLYTLFKYIKEKTDVKIVLCGEGLDEMFPESELSNTQFQDKSIENLQELSNTSIHLLDCMSAMFDIEVRYPYLGIEFRDFVMSIHPNLRRGQVYDSSRRVIEKYIIRKSFESCIPDCILWKPMGKMSLGCCVEYF